MANTETEVKFVCTSPESMRDQIFSIGALFSDRVFESNIIFDTQNDVLRAEGKLLRLRKDKQNILTAKLPVHNSFSECKNMEEREVIVDNFEKTASILEAIGFSPKRKYEKYRETFLLGDLLILIDTMPFGTFVELEGEENAIKLTAKKLGLDWNKRIVINYMQMFSLLKEQLDLTFCDLTFSHFDGIVLPYDSYETLFCGE